MVKRKQRQGEVCNFSAHVANMMRIDIGNIRQFDLNKPKIYQIYIQVYGLRGLRFKIYNSVKRHSTAL